MRAEKATRESAGKHRLRVRRSNGIVYEWNATKRPPWMKKADARRRGKAARLARRVTRRRSR